MNNILVIGALGQIGTALTEALRIRHGEANVVAADVRSPDCWLHDGLAFEQVNVLEAEALRRVLIKHGVSEVYLLAAMLSATGEKLPQKAWNLNMQSLMHCLELAKEGLINKLFWPSSIAVFGPDAPKVSCPQWAAQHPATMYGITKSAGEKLCLYYHETFGVDVRSLRYPGLISHEYPPGGGTTDYAVDIYHAAVQNKVYECFLDESIALPMMYMPDSVRATIELMEAKSERLTIRTSYNLAAMSFTPAQIVESIRKVKPAFSTIYVPDYRQAIATSWPGSLDDIAARADWGWWPRFNLEAMTRDMLSQLARHSLFPHGKTELHEN